MALRPTPRIRGVHMVTVVTNHHIDGDYLTRAVCLYALDNLDPDTLPDTVSKSAVEKYLRNALYQAGMDRLDWFSDRVSDSDFDDAALWTWARDRVLTLWPALTVSERH
jgi:hypothetical protein